MGTQRARAGRYAAAFALVAGLGLLAVATHPWSWSPQPRSSGTAAPPTAAPPAATPSSTRGPEPSAGAHGVADRIEGPVLRVSRPVALTIPRLGVSTGLETLGLDADGAMQVPQDPALAGWYARGPAPGSLGPAVIAGHVTWNGAPAVFADLADLRPGDLVRVARADGRVAVFGVTRIEQYAKSVFPTDQVFGASDHAALRLITCGGEYDDDEHRYEDNVVVFARLLRA